jgi:hypothetical protein
LGLEGIVEALKGRLFGAGGYLTKYIKGASNKQEVHFGSVTVELPLLNRVLYL